MNTRAVQMWIGVLTIVASAFLVLYAVPNWISSPSNVPKIILSPLFWPYVLAGVTGLIGLSLILTTIGRSGIRPPPEEANAHRAAGFARLLAMGITMIATMEAVPRLGMVWTVMLVFVAVAFLVRTTHRRTALVCAVVVPLVLYVFFQHVAGVGIPQGEFVRLP